MNYMLETKTYILEDEMTCRGTPVLKYRIAYPQFRSLYFQKTLARLGAYYRLEAMRLQLTARKSLYPMAVQQYLDSLENGYPVMEYEVDADYTVTYNQRCALSLYTDQYIFTGGAHGNTTRFANTWDLKTGEPLTLQDLMSVPEYKVYVIDQIIGQIEESMKNGEGTYFDEYRTNVPQQFDPGQFYLTPAGVVIYFQQYAIAPYSSGIPTFLIPYSRTVHPPQC